MGLHFRTFALSAIVSMAATLAFAAPVSPVSALDKAASAKAVASLSGTLLSTIASLPAKSKEPIFEAQLAADLEVSNQPQEIVVRALRLSLQKVCPGGKCRPRAAGDALIALLNQRRLKTRALDNGATSPFNNPNFNGGGGGSNYVP
jgi:hypothetical protein